MSPRKATKPGSSLLRNHNRCWIWGRHAVLETLRAGKWPVLTLLVAEDVDPSVRREVQALLSPETEVEFVAASALAKRCRADDHQGLAIAVGPFPYAPVEVLDDWRNDPSASGSVLILDRIHDAQNFGSIVRSAEVLGQRAVIVGQSHQAEVTSHVVRSSAGAVNHVPIVQVPSLVAFARRLRDAGVSLIGATEKGSVESGSLALPARSALVIGNEGLGISDEVLALCDVRLKIPVLGAVGSLNAAVAAGILLYEMQRQSRSPQAIG